MPSTRPKSDFEPSLPTKPKTLSGDWGEKSMDIGAYSLAYRRLTVNVFCEYVTRGPFKDNANVNEVEHPKQCTIQQNEMS